MAGTELTRDSLENIEDGVPTGLVRRLEHPDLDGDVAGLKLNGGFTISSFGLMHCLLSWSLEVGLFKPGTLVAAPSCTASSDGPVNRCTTSLKVFESVCTNVVKGLPLVAA
ncbi:putative pentatricopeptide repeat-containing protein [Corchorus olitorius]|uniref:Pentatricopeptide repeat-containing protein n=1 Tax=Corchorus olitorius TaxID=93759 RepID=A0A1R3GSQ4_9ROSI|nr:putative pentatricopeptide repeat-containing protein [Corchorus olitorius]